jgi:hypothetical protein
MSSLIGGYTHIKTRGEKVISSSALKTKRSYKKIKGGKKYKTLKRRKHRKSKRRY